MTVMVIKAALSELGCLQAHVQTVLCNAVLKILSHILNEFLLLAPKAGRHDYGSHPASTMDIFFSFVVVMLITSFLAFLCLTADHNLFFWISLSFGLPALPPHSSDEGWGQPLHKEMIRNNKPPEDTVFTFPKWGFVCIQVLSLVH